MKTLIKNKKGVMQLSIVILVLATLVLVVSAIFFFSYKQDSLAGQVYPGAGIDEVYSRAEILNFQLRDICSKLQSEENPVENFKTEFLEYKKNGVFVNVDMSQIESQIDSSHIRIDENANLTIRFNITIIDQNPKVKEYGIDGLDTVSYNYNFYFEEIMS